MKTGLRNRLPLWGALGGLLVWFLSGGGALASEATGAPAPPNPGAPPTVAAAVGRLPLYFIENKGQVDRRVKYYVHSGGQTTFFTPKEVVIVLRPPEATPEPQSRRRNLREGVPFAGQRSTHKPPTVVRLRPVGLQRGVTLTARGQTSHRVNYFHGRDPRHWQTDIPTYQAVVYDQAYPGIDLKFYGQGRELEYDIVVHPGADPGQVRFAYQGVKKLELTPEGDLALFLPDGGRLVQKKPVAYQEINGVRIAREARYQLDKGGARLRCGLAVAAYDRRYPLVIDPVLLYSTYLGGSDGDLGLAVAVDAAGCAYVTGRTDSYNFPLRNPYQSWIIERPGVFVSKLNPSGNELVYSTYLSGSDWDIGNGIAVDGQGRAVVTGETSSPDFPVYQAYQSIYGGGSSEVFVTKLTATGNGLVYSTYLGGYGWERGQGVAVDQAGAAYVTGVTTSTNFPVQTAYQGFQAGHGDAFVTKLSSSGALVFSTYLGGSDYDYGTGIAVDETGKVYLTGTTTSGDFPTKNAYQSRRPGDYDAFVTKLYSTGNALVFSTYLGGTGEDMGEAIAVDRRDHTVVVFGTTGSSDFPCQGYTQPPYQTSLKGGCDTFLTKLDSRGRALIFSTYLGGPGSDFAQGLALNQSTGDIYVTGTYDLWGGGLGGQILFARADQTGKVLFFAPLAEGSGRGIAVDQNGAVYLCGSTSSRFFPTVNPFQGTLRGSDDAFVMKLQDGGDLTPVLELLLGQ